MDSRVTRYHPGAVTPIDVVLEARRWVHVPYRHQGRSEFGFDCIGFVIWVMHRLTILPPDFERHDYGRLPKDELVQKAAVYCEPIDKPQMGTLMLIRWPGERRAGHAAIYAADTLIHCFQAYGRVVEHGYRGHWVKRTESCWRLPGVNYG